MNSIRKITIKIILINLILSVSLDMRADTIPDAYGHSNSSYFNKMGNQMHDFLHSFITHNDGFNFMLSTSMVMSSPLVYKLAKAGDYKAAATTLIGSMIAFVGGVYNLSELTVLSQSIFSNSVNYLSQQEPTMIYPLDDKDHVISQSIAEISLAIPPAAKQTRAWLYNNLAWYWNTAFNSSNNRQLALTLSQGLPYIDIKPAQQGWGNYIYSRLFGDGADYARDWLQAMKALSEAIPEGQILRLFFSRSKIHGLSLQALLIEQDEKGDVLTSSPRLAINMAFPANARSILDEIAAGYFGRHYANAPETETYTTDQPVISVLDQAILQNLTQALSQFSLFPEQTAFDFPSESCADALCTGEHRALLPVTLIPKRLSLMAFTLDRATWLFEDDRFPDNPEKRAFVIAFAQKDHWVINPSLSATEQLANQQLRDQEFNRIILKRLEGQVLYHSDRSATDWSKLLLTAKLKVARAFYYTP